MIYNKTNFREFFSKVKNSIISYPVNFEYDTSVLKLSYGQHFIKLNYDSSLNYYNIVLDSVSEETKSYNHYCIGPSLMESVLNKFKDISHKEIISLKDWNILLYESSIHNKNPCYAVYLIKNINSNKYIQVHMIGCKGINYQIKSC